MSMNKDLTASATAVSSSTFSSTLSPRKISDSTTLSSIHRSPSPPPLATTLAATLNQHFRHGQPHGDLNHAGVLIRTFDKFTLPGRHWLSAPQWSIWAASLVSAQYPFAYEKSSEGGFVLAPDVVTPCLKCSYHEDRASSDKACPRSSTSTIPATVAPCVPGCRAASCRLQVGYSCNTAAGRAQQLNFTLSLQVRELHAKLSTKRSTPSSRHSTFASKSRQGLRHEEGHHQSRYNELVFSSACLARLMPLAIMCVVRSRQLGRQSSSDGRPLTRPEGEAVAVHRNFLAAFNLSATAFPILEMDLANRSQPFSAP